MAYAIGVLAIAFVAWKIYKIVSAKNVVDLSNPNVGRGAIRPDKPSDLNDI